MHDKQPQDDNPQISECKVYAENDRIAADIYAPELNESEVKEYVNSVNGKLPIYKRIYKVRVMETEIKKTASGKIKREV